MAAIMISGAASGSGKTTVVCGILKVLKNRGINVKACKCGPDYIDTMFHTRVLGVSSKNIDSFFCDDELLKQLYGKHTSDGDITVIEGAMGYYDGLSMDSTRASGYDIARKLGIPVVIVINAKGMALTVNAVLKGIMKYREDSNIKGVILNNVSESVYKSLKNVIENELKIAVVGYMPHDKECSFESRHLGLVTPESINNISEKIEKLGNIAQMCIDFELLMNIARQAEKIDFKSENIYNISKSKVKVGIALDDAFCFYYRDNIELLKKMGCEIVYFSPIGDKRLPEKIDGVIFGGGYPELYCRQLSQNKSMLDDVRNRLEGGLPCLAECGGFMYLHNEITDRNGTAYKMAGIIDAEAFYCDKLVRFGYANVRSNNDCFALNKGETIKAHEFHYWDSTSNGNAFTAEKPNGKRSWQCIHTYKNIICGFPHLFYYSNINFVNGFIKKCGGK